MEESTGGGKTSFTPLEDVKKYEFVDFEDGQLNYVDGQVDVKQLNGVFKTIFSFMAQQVQETCNIKMRLSALEESKIDIEKELKQRGFFEVEEKVLRLAEEIAETQKHVNERMVTKSDLLTQEMKINRLASAEELEKLHIALEDTVAADDFFQLASQVEASPSRIELERLVINTEKRIMQLEEDLRRMVESRVQTVSFLENVGSIRQSLSDLQRQSFAAIGGLQEWREVVDDDMEATKVDLETNVVKRDEWNKFMEHAEGFATGDITEQIMHDIRTSQLQIDKLVRDNRELFEGVKSHATTLETKADRTDVLQLKEWGVATYATQLGLEGIAESIGSTTSNLQDAVESIQSTLSKKADASDILEQRAEIFDVENKIDILMADVQDKSSQLEVLNLRQVTENVQQQLTFLLNQIEGLKSLSKQTSELVSNATFGTTAPPPNISVPSGSLTGLSVSVLSNRARRADQVLVQMEESKRKLELHIKDTSNTTHSRDDELGQASDSNKKEKYETKLREVSDRIEEQRLLLAELKEAIAQKSTEALHAVSDDVASSKEPQTDSKPETKLRPASAAEPNKRLDLEKRISNAPVVKIAERSSQNFQIQSTPSQEIYETHLPSAGVRCLFCDRATPRISQSTQFKPKELNRIDYQNAAKKSYQARPATAHIAGRPQSARVRKGRLISNGNDDLKPEDRNSPPHRSFRITALVPTNQVHATLGKNDVGITKLNARPPL